VRLLFGFSATSEVAIAIGERVGYVCKRCRLNGSDADLLLGTHATATAHMAQHVEAKHRGAEAAAAKLAETQAPGVAVRA